MLKTSLMKTRSVYGKCIDKISANGIKNLYNTDRDKIEQMRRNLERSKPEEVDTMWLY